MKLYLLEQDKVSGYDTYDSAVVCAASAEEARNMHPSGRSWGQDAESWFKWADTWAEPEHVTCTEIGHATSDKAVKCVWCASFNAG